MEVIKRDGRLETYDQGRIVVAITKAMAQSEAGIDLDLANEIAERIKSSNLENKVNQISVEEIQDMVEKQLMETERKEVARGYITYRYNRDIARKSKTRNVFLEIIEAKANDITRENANMNADTPAGMMMKFASETTKLFVDDFLLSKEARAAFRDGYIHIHDKDYYPTKSLTCLQHPLDKILKEGFKAGHGSSRPAKRIETASILGCISMETTQNEMHGGQSIPAFDYYLAPYVRSTYVEEIGKIEELIAKDLRHLYEVEITDYLKGDLEGLKGDERYKQWAINKTVNRVHQSMEAFIHNMNTIHSRGGNQVVFSSINYGTDTSPEGRAIIREVLLSTYKGVGKDETPIFPIQIFKKKRGENYLPEDRSYDLYQLACKVTAKRFFPNFINLDATFNQHPKWNENDGERFKYEVATMGCRTRVFENRHGENTCIGRGNISFSTINLVKPAIEAAREIRKKYDMDIAVGAGNVLGEEYLEEIKRVYLSKIDHLLEVTSRQLYDRYKFQRTALAKQFPLLMNSLWLESETLGEDDPIEKVLKHGSLSIGYIGLAEALVALFGKHHGESPASQDFGLELITRMKKYCDDVSDFYDLNYSLLATPAEGLAGRFTKLDRREFGSIEGVTDRDYYTNSNHVPVYYKCRMEDKAKIEAPYHTLTRAGHIFYIELDGDAIHNPDSIKGVVDLMDKYNMGYGSVNHTRVRCLECGFETGKEKLSTCPYCGSGNLDVIQRITGYLVGTSSRWNGAKLAELHDRVKHN